MVIAFVETLTRTGGDKCQGPARKSAILQELAVLMCRHCLSGDSVKKTANTRGCGCFPGQIWLTIAGDLSKPAKFNPLPIHEAPSF